MRVEMGYVDAGGIGRLDLRAKLGLDGLGMRQPARGGDVGVEIAEVVDEAGSAGGSRERTPFVVAFFGVEREVDADVERRIACGGFRELEEPGAGRHDGAGTADARLHQLEEGGVGAVAHADIVFVKHEAAPGAGRAHRLASFLWTQACVSGRPKFVPEIMEPTV